MSAYDKEAALIDQAKREGIEEGITEGIEQNKKEIIMNMLNNNYELEEISRIVNIDIEELKKIVIN